MALSNPIQNFGIYQVTMSLLSDPSVKGTAKVIGDFNPNMNQELIHNRGGASAFPWASAPGDAEGSIATVFKQYDKNILRILNAYISGSIVENASGDTGGAAENLANVYGTSVVNATSGIASIAVDASTKANLAYGNYIIKATAAGTFDLYLDLDISGLVTYVDDSLKINSAAITLPGTSGTVVYQGVEFTSGSGAANMTVGDMARFNVRPVNSYSLQHFIHKTGSTPQEFELIIAAEKIDSKIRTIRFPRCIADGSAILKCIRKDWSTIEANITILQPSTVDYVGIQEFVNR